MKCVIMVSHIHKNYFYNLLSSQGAFHCNDKVTGHCKFDRNLILKILKIILGKLTLWEAKKRSNNFHVKKDEEI